jgi:hypothetical protein
MNIQQFKFDSKFCKEFQVVEEVRGKVRLFPHTLQLPVLHQALDREFRAPLSQLISRVNACSDDYWKIVLKDAAFIYCQLVNSGRPDKLRLFCLLNPDKVAKITILQQITEESPMGQSHRFRFYGGGDFFPEIRMSGKRLVFSDHVLQRFNQRARNKVVEDLAAFLLTFFKSPIVAMAINRGQALVLPSPDGFLAFTFKETSTEYFITTCLSVNEINDIKPIVPSITFDLHYGESYTRPRIRNWNPLEAMVRFVSLWQQRNPLEPMAMATFRKDWPAQAKVIQLVVRSRGHGADSRLHFLDSIPGPNFIEFLPNQPLLQFDEAAFLASQSQELIQSVAAVRSCPSLPSSDI